MTSSKWNGFESYSSAMFMLPEIGGMGFGVLRREYKLKRNTLDGWLLPKLHLDAGASTRVTGVRSDVLLPVWAPDMLLDPVALCQGFEREAGALQKDLALHLELRIDGRQPLHQWWEAARDFARGALVDDLHLPVVLVLHRPANSGFREANAPHIHVMALARELDARGFGRSTDAACDHAHAAFAERWRQALAAAGLESP